MRHERLGRAAMSVLLSVAMAAGGVPAAPPAALAEEPATATITPGEGGTGTGEMAVTLTIPWKTPTAADLAYTAPADLAYSGEAKDATVVAATGVVGMGDITVGYYSDEARTTAVDPVNVRTYYVGATVEAGDNYEASANVLYGDGWTFAIAKSTPDAPAVPSVESKDKNSVTLRGEDGCEYSRDGIAWQESPTFAGLLPSTEYDFYQRYKETANTNASAASGKLSVTTDPDTYAMAVTLTVAAPGYTAPGARSLTYSGEDQQLVDAGTATGGTMQYALGTSDETAPTGGWAADAADIKGNAAGTYHVWYKVVGDSSHGGVAPACVDVTIAKKPIAPTVSIDGWTYGEAAKAPSLGEGSNPGEGAVTYGYKAKGAADETYVSEPPTAAGDYVVRASVAETTNHAAGAATAEFAVARKPVTVSGITASNKTYDGKTDAELGLDGATISGRVGTDDLSVTATGAFADANAGEGKTVSISGLALAGAAKGNYALAQDGQQETATATISPREVTVSGIKAASRAYDGTTDATLDLDGATIDGRVGTDDLSVTATGKFADANAGEGKTVSISGLALAGAAKGNYALAQDGQQEETKATISPRAVTVSADDKATAYGTNPAALTLAVSKGTLASPADLASLGVVASCDVKRDTPVGTYPIRLAGGEANPNYEVTLDGGTYTVTNARLTVSATGWSGEYDGKPHGITVTVRPAAANASVWYSTRRLTAANYTVAGSRAPVTRTDPGTTTVYYYVVAPNHEAVAGSKDVTVNSSVIGLTGTGHVQRDGDAAAKPSGKGIVIGTTGQSKRLEQFSVALPEGTDGSIEYRGHLQGIGWGEWVADGKPCGTTGESRRMEAVQMRLTGALAETHSVWYRVHSQTWGTLGWARDGQAAGTAGQSKRAEAIEVQVLPKGQVPEGYVEREASYVGAISANVHLQNQGWTGASSAIEFGTTGQSRRLEAVRLSGPATPLSGGISYEVHAQSRGWMPAAADGALAGTTGQSKRLEAVRISLTGDAAKDGGYSVWYRVHSQTYGWLGWAHDGQEAGTTGLSKRAEAIDVQVLPQGQVPRGYDASRAACVSE